MISKSETAEKAWTAINLLGRKKNIVIVYVILITGIILLSIGSFLPEKEVKTEPDAAVINSDMEKRIENALSEIDGVGRTRVLITYKTKGEVVPALNTNESGSKDSETGSGTVRESVSSGREESVVLIGSGGSQKPIVVKEFAPSVQGVIVIAEGGSDAKIKQDIIEAVTVLTGVSPHNVGVFTKKIK